jgi:hypothetical protein
MAAKLSWVPVVAVAMLLSMGVMASLRLIAVDEQGNELSMESSFTPSETFNPQRTTVYQERDWWKSVENLKATREQCKSDEEFMLLFSRNQAAYDYVASAMGINQ